MDLFYDLTLLLLLFMIYSRTTDGQAITMSFQLASNCSDIAPDGSSILLCDEKCQAFAAAYPKFVSSNPSSVTSSCSLPSTFTGTATCQCTIKAPKLTPITCPTCPIPKPCSKPIICHCPAMPACICPNKTIG